MKIISIMAAACVLSAAQSCRQHTENEKNNNHKNYQTMQKQDNTPLYPKGQPLPSDWFSGNAFITPLVAQDKNNEFSAASVTFEPGARTNWHTHPKGQVLLVTQGEGLYQQKGRAAQVIKKGDVVNIPENVEHWHGASKGTQMTHIAITNFKDDQQVTWLQPVSDKEFAEANIHKDQK